LAVVTLRAREGLSDVPQSITNPDGEWFSDDQVAQIDAILPKPRKRIIALMYPQKVGGTFTRTALSRALKWPILRGRFLNRTAGEFQLDFGELLAFLSSTRHEGGIIHSHAHADVGSIRILSMLGITPHVRLRPVSAILCSIYRAYKHGDIPAPWASPPPDEREDDIKDHLTYVTAPQLFRHASDWRSAGVSAGARVCHYYNYLASPEDELRELLRSERLPVDGLKAAYAECWGERRKLRVVDGPKMPPGKWLGYERMGHLERLAKMHKCGDLI
jgi:hypothetical protein